VGGIALGFIGTVLIAPGEADAAGFALEPGTGYLLLAALAFSFGSVVQKPLLSRLPAIPATAYYVVAATLGLCGFAPGLGRALRPRPLRRIGRCLSRSGPMRSHACRWSKWLARFTRCQCSLFRSPGFGSATCRARCRSAGGAIALAGVLLVQLKGR